MTASNLFAYDRSGSYIVMGDGKELLVHSGADESPLWQKTLDATLVGLGTAGDTIVTLDENGRLTYWNGRDGAEINHQNLGTTPRAFALAASGAAAVTLPDAVAVASRTGELQKIPIMNAGAVAFSDDGGRLA